MTDTARLRSLAEAATPGPWHHHPHDMDETWSESVFVDGFPLGRIVIARAETAEAAYIAAADPQTILALLDENAALRAVRDAADNMLEHNPDRGCPVADRLRAALAAADKAGDR